MNMVEVTEVKYNWLEEQNHIRVEAHKLLHRILETENLNQLTRNEIEAHLNLPKSPPIHWKA